MLFHNSVKLLSRNLSLKTVRELALKITISNPQNLSTKRYCSCLQTTPLVTGIHSSKFLASQRYFVSPTSPLFRRHEDDDESDNEEDVMQGDKILKTRLSTDRLDTVIKTGLQISKSKIEKIFFQDRIRVNGIRPTKKSQVVRQGDEIDIILRYNAKNPEYLDVSRLFILKLEGYSHLDHEDSDDEAMMPAKLKRTKNLTIENYSPPFKGNLEEE